MRKYRTAIVLYVALSASFLVHGQEASQPPLKLVKTITVPGMAEGDWDHMCVDLEGGRLFSAHEDNQTVECFDLKTGEHLASIGKGILQQPHSMAYRNDLKQLFVVDGDTKMGAVRIYDGSSNDFKQIKSVDFPIRADWSRYDPATHILYVNNNQKNKPKAKSSFAEIFDTTAQKIVGEIPIHDDTITDFQLENDSSKMYTCERTLKKVAVIDREKRKVIAEWPMTLGEGMGHLGLDPMNHRLFVNCRYGQMVIFNTETGNEVGAIPINQYSDENFYDSARKRIYIMASGAVGVGHGSIEVIQQIDADHYKSLGELPTGTDSRNGIFIPELNRIYVSVPRSKEENAKILVFETLD